MFMICSNRSLMRVPAHLDNGEERLCVVLRVLQNVICKVNKQKWQKFPWWVRERPLGRMWWRLFVSKTTLTQQLPHHTADGISVVLSRFICKYKRHCEDKVNLVKSPTRIHCEQKWGRSSVIRTVFHPSVEGRLVQVHHAVDSGVERKFGIHWTHRN